MIHCIGDSHANFFSGWDAMGPAFPRRSFGRLPFFRSYRLGPVLAYSLHREGTTNRGRENLFAILDRLPAGSRVLLCFGEIDCRAHLLRQAEQKNRPIEEVVRDCVEKYFSVFEELQRKGFAPIAWGVTPSTAVTVTDPAYPTYGTCAQRNAITRLFNTTLAGHCRSAGIPFVSIYHELVDANDLTDMTYFSDSIHLSQRAMPLALRAFRQTLPELSWANHATPLRTLTASMLNRAAFLFHKGLTSIARIFGHHPRTA
ncbi:MAG: SGNH/GDSL hydrolase family protein [Candidatus Yanofskybacteria bacterium]|nr:SGNH/GDSL hydrolase family protein [Candidatus Yanofskybacteria bacterium]